jgi:hypothetical protein
MIDSAFAFKLRAKAGIVYEKLKQPIRLVGVGEAEAEVTHATILELEIEGRFHVFKVLIGRLPADVHILLGWKNICERSLFPLFQKLGWKNVGEDMDYEAVEEDEWEASVLYHTLLINEDQRGNSLMDRMKSEFKEVFCEQLAEGGAEVSPMVIELIEGARPIKQQPRRASVMIYDFIAKTINQWKDMRIIRDSTSDYASPVHVVQSATRDWRMCIDFREMNKRVKDQHYPLPNLKNVLEQLKGNCWFAKLDLRKGYLQAPLSKESIKFTSFVTNQGQFEFLRVPFGLKTAVSYYQRIMATEVLEGLVGDICQNFLDDIIVFATTHEELIARLRKVLERLSKRRLRVNEKKCLFGVQEIGFLGFIVSKEGLRLDPAKVQGLVDLDMTDPKDVMTVKSFLGLANYFAEFIPNLSAVAYPLFHLTKKGVKFVWTQECKDAVEEIKRRAINAPLLMYPDWEKPLVLRTDASIRGIGGALFNVIDGKEQPIAYISKALSHAAKKWSTKEQECFAIFYCVQALYFYLMGRPFCIETDHKNLIYMKTNVTNNRVTRWWMKLQEFDFMVLHIAGESNVVADALSRCLVLVTDPTGEEVEMSEEEVTNLLKRHHNALTGHQGITETVRKLSKSGYKWKNMRSDIIRFVHECGVCQKKLTRPAEEETRRETVIDVYEPFEEISIDTITCLPVDGDGYTSIIVCVDSFTRFVELYPTKDLTAASAAKALLSLFGRYGVARGIRSDRGQQYCAQVIQELLELLRLSHTKTIGYRPEANGLVERSNRKIKDALRAILFENDTLRENWSLALPLVQRIINATVHKALGVSPASLIFGDRLDLDRGIVIPFGESRGTAVASEWVAKMQKIQREVWAAAQKHLAEVADQRIESRQESADPRKTARFKVGDYVLRCDSRTSERDEGARSTLSLPWLGPYIIVNRIGNIFTLKDLNTRKNLSVDISEIKQFVAQDGVAEAGLARMAAIDYNEQRVEKILNHREREETKLVGKTKLGKKDYEFLVLFEDGTEEWLPYMEVRNCEQLSVYIDAVPKSELITKLFLIGGNA